MQKYLTLLQQMWQTHLAYPLSFLIWRFRQILSLTMSLTVWSVIFNQNHNVFGYERSEMFTYVLLIGILQSTILATDLHSLANDIYSGAISNVLVKPVNILGLFIAREAADKFKNIVFSILEAGILILIFKPVLTIPSSEILVLCLIWIFLGIVIHFFIQILFGTMGFRSPSVWGPKFLFFMVVEATAGKLFPLDILPDIVQKIFLLTPLPYLAYVQTQLFLGRLEGTQIMTISVGLLFWSLLLGLITKYVWKKGIKEYGAAGR